MVVIYMKQCTESIILTDLAMMWLSIRFPGLHLWKRQLERKSCAWVGVSWLVLDWSASWCISFWQPLKLLFCFGSPCSQSMLLSQFKTDERDVGPRVYFVALGLENSICAELCWKPSVHCQIHVCLAVPCRTLEKCLLHPFFAILKVLTPL